MAVSWDGVRAAPDHNVAPGPVGPPIGQEKSPRHYCLGLNPPIEEVEETIGPAIENNSKRMRTITEQKQCRVFDAAVQYARALI
jgi:hypothetical protein